jgi:hypothetical protein
MKRDPNDILQQLWDAISNKIQDSRHGEMISESDLIYHYTTAAGLKGILENKYIFFTHYLYLNDLSEIMYGMGEGDKFLREELELARSILTQRLDPILEDASIVNKLEAHKELVTKYGKPFALINEAISVIDSWPPQNIYITSFCKSGDLLSQWRGYANRGGGYAIGLSVVNRQIATDKGQFEAFKVVYDPARRTEVLKEILNETLNALDSTEFPSSIDDAYKLLIQQFAVLLAGAIRLVGGRFKNPAFSEEDEWRFCIETDLSDLDSVKFRDANGLLIPYLEIPLTSSGIKVRKIVCGPTLHPELARRSVEMLAQRSGFMNVEIENSRIPLGSC